MLKTKQLRLVVPADVALAVLFRRRRELGVHFHESVHVEFRLSKVSPQNKKTHHERALMLCQGEERRFALRRLPRQAHNLPPHFGLPRPLAAIPAGQRLMI